MKKFIYTILLALFIAPNFIQAQEAAGAVGPISSFPVVYKYDEKVTWYFDMSASTFSETEDLYMWIWSPSEPDAGNFDNSSDFAKLKYEGNKIWSFTLTPTLYFSKTPDEIAASAGFWFRLKNKNGSKQSDVANVAYTDFSSFYTANEVIRSYPSKPTIDKPVSILFNSNLKTGFAGVESVHFHSGLNNWAVLQEYQAWLPDVSEKTKMKDLGNGFYRMDLIPQQYYNTQPGFVMENIIFLLVAKDWATNSGDQIIYAGEFVPPPPPSFRFFPSQISQKDFLGMSRKNNEAGVNKLLYTVTAGSKTISGEFAGGTAEIKGFINLVSELNGIPNLNEIHVLVKDNKNNTISDSTIPLKTLDK
ncbi:hypothetical protein [Flavobacterium reichenbachii]|uniref:Uncharacterized protein n=1 Tax=Flavobacterium reichenbachii TaxID=362418 RepID=A0A085ZFV4_9FLAO|nr:hypothetical protein [Flavobacterium reichenbachii]KFF03318.1 hypothetical protein IW19_20735 [Flavobacterium reichenbachii]OXB15289.1 hypothetical protein B0A68_11305 [Flavobacterium reichenbachii]